LFCCRSIITVMVLQHSHEFNGHHSSHPLNVIHLKLQQHSDALNNELTHALKKLTHTLMLLKNYALTPLLIINDSVRWTNPVPDMWHGLQGQADSLANKNTWSFRHCFHSAGNSSLLSHTRWYLQQNEHQRFCNTLYSIADVIQVSTKKWQKNNSHPG